MTASKANTNRGMVPGTDAEWYDRSINWSARLNREIPVLTEVFGPPENGRVLDAGCGTGRQALALAERGYSVVGADINDEMLIVARRHAKEAAAELEFVHAPYADLFDTVGGGFAGVYCLANALAAAGSRDAVNRAIEQFGRCLRPGGRLFIQILNFEPMRQEQPCVRGPRIATVDGRQYLSARQFHFFNDLAQVTNITFWDDDGWQMRTHCGVLCPIEHVELGRLLTTNGIEINDRWGNYARDEFDPATSVDLIVTATRG